MKLRSKVFDNHDEAKQFAKTVRGFIETTTDDKLCRSYIVFYRWEEKNMALYQVMVRVASGRTFGCELFQTRKQADEKAFAYRKQKKTCGEKIIEVWVEEIQ